MQERIEKSKLLCKRVQSCEEATISDQPNREAQEITVTLVHGTFARNAEWTDINSELSKT
jgi:hypothetical protein